MAIDRSEWIWIEGEWRPWDQATIHVTAHSLHYGSGAFEGIRAYETKNGTAVFRLGAHIRRLMDSCKILRMELPEYPQERIEQIAIESVVRNQLKSCYIRPLVYRRGDSLGLNPTDCTSDLAIFSVFWGAYLGDDAIEHGVDAAISSWRRFNASTSSPLGKIAGQYVTSSFVSVEARQNGFHEGIMLDERGHVSEGAGENMFLVKDGALITPPTSASILAGITRDSVLVLADDLGIPVRHESITRDELYLADEIFMTGTAAEISPIRTVDRIEVGSGKPGPVTKALQAEFFGIVRGDREDRHDWLTPVPHIAPVAAAAD